MNRLNEVVVTGSIEATERAKVPFAIGRVTSEELPVPSLDPMTSLEGKVAGVRIASTSGQPGSTPDIMLRGPTSLNLSGRSGNPLIVVDGVVMNVGNLGELGGLDIESIEVIKGAAGASLYGTTAANGVITIKTKRGANSDGITVQRPRGVRRERLEQRPLRPAGEHPPPARRDGQALLHLGHVDVGVRAPRRSTG